MRPLRLNAMCSVFSVCVLEMTRVSYTPVAAVDSTPFTLPGLSFSARDCSFCTRALLSFLVGESTAPGHNEPPSLQHKLPESAHNWLVYFLVFSSSPRFLLSITVCREICFQSDAVRTLPVASDSQGDAYQRWAGSRHEMDHGTHRQRLRRSRMGS